MPDSAPQQLLHLVIGGELLDLEHNTFKNLDDVEIVGLYPNYATATPPGGRKAQSDGRQRADALFHRPSPPAARLQIKNRSRRVEKTASQYAAKQLRSACRRGHWRPNICVWSGGPTNSRSIRRTSTSIVEPQIPAIFAFWHGQHFLTPFIKNKDWLQGQGPDLPPPRRRVQRDRRRAARHRHHPRFRRPWRRLPPQGRGRRLQGNGADAPGRL